MYFPSLAPSMSHRHSQGRQLPDDDGIQPRNPSIAPSSGPAPPPSGTMLSYGGGRRRSIGASGYTSSETLSQPTQSRSIAAPPVAPSDASSAHAQPATQIRAPSNVRAAQHIQATAPVVPPNSIVAPVRAASVPATHGETITARARQKLTAGDRAEPQRRPSLPGHSHAQAPPPLVTAAPVQRYSGPSAPVPVLATAPALPRQASQSHTSAQGQLPSAAQSANGVPAPLPAAVVADMFKGISDSDSDIEPPEEAIGQALSPPVVALATKRTVARGHGSGVNMVERLRARGGDGSQAGSQHRGTTSASTSSSSARRAGTATTDMGTPASAPVTVSGAGTGADTGSGGQGSVSRAKTTAALPDKRSARADDSDAEAQTPHALTTATFRDGRRRSVDQRHLQHGYSERADSALQALPSTTGDPRARKPGPRRDSNKHSIYDSPADYALDSSSEAAHSTRSRGATSIGNTTAAGEEREVDLGGPDAGESVPYTNRTRYSGKGQRMKVTAVPSPGTDADGKLPKARTEAAARSDATAGSSTRSSSKAGRSTRTPGGARTPLISSARPPHTPYNGVRESYEELVDVNTVPVHVQREFEAEYLATMEDFNKDELPPDVERWTVKLPTRLEFRNVTVRVMKPKPNKEKEPDLEASIRCGTSEPATPLQMQHDPRPPTQPAAAADPFAMCSDSDEEEDRPHAMKSAGWPIPFLNRGNMAPQVILDNLSGVIEPGKMVAIMGASGAGKTTLLNALSGRIRLKPVGAGQPEVDPEKPVCSGNIMFNGTRVSEEELASMTGYVLQEDVLLGTLSPRETLTFAARTQLPVGMSEERKLKRVERVLRQLDLMHVADSPIGTAFVRGISGGERRRVSVGVEMVRDPSVLFLDEPTSGLDSSTAVKVMRVLKHLAQSGRTVIFTIHSPNSKILALFDTLILLTRGRLAYFGAADRALQYFASLGYACPASMNAAEFFLSVLQLNTTDMLRGAMAANGGSASMGVTPLDPRFKSLQMLWAKMGARGQAWRPRADEDADEDVVVINGQRQESVAARVRRHARQLPMPSVVEAYAHLRTWQVERLVAVREDKRLTAITDKYLRMPVRRDERLHPFLSNYLPKMRAQGSDSADSGSEWVKPGVPPLPFLAQLRELSARTFKHVIRQPLNTIARVLVNLLLSFFVGILFWQTGYAQQSVYARVGFLFFMTSIQAFITVVAAVLTFTEERALFLREKMKHIYGTSAYFLGRTAVDIGMQTGLSVLFGLPAYWMVGLQSDFGKFVQFCICLVMVGQSSQSYALILGALIPYRTVALMLSPIVMVPFMMTTGFFVTMSSIPGWLKWLCAISPQRYVFESLMDIEFTGLVLQCRPEEMITVPLDNGQLQRYCPLQRGEDVTQLFGLERGTYAYNMIMVLVLTVVVRVVAYGCLRWSAYYHMRTSGGG